MASRLSIGRGAIVRTMTLSIACLIACAATGARAEMNAKLPTTTPCQTGAAPELPAKWHAITLMMPFLDGQVDVGELTYDATVPAMRATVYGLESGAVDLLITEKDTYRLSGPHDAPTQCKSLGRMFQPSQLKLLSEKSVCVGEARLATRSVEWWKSPGHGTQANWHWFRMRTRLPWRSVFTSPSQDHPIVGQYAMTYFPTFTEVHDTNLGKLSALCASRSAASGPATTPPPVSARALLTDDKAANAERRTRIGTLVHGLGHEGCTGAKPTRWPEHFVMTTTLVPISFADEPTTSLIYYDWGPTGGQFAVMFQGRPLSMRGLVGMKKGIGYRLQHHSSGPQCEAVFPGMVRPDWMAAANCQCRATLATDSPFGLAAPSHVFSCPIKHQPGHVMWSWYTGEGEPIVFFEALARGGGVMLADTHQWLPGAKVPAANFQLPGACYADDAQRGSGARFDFPDCADCHTMR